MRIQGPRQPGVSRAEAVERDGKTSTAKARQSSEPTRGGDVVKIGSSAKSLAARGAELGPEIKARLDLVRQQLRNNEYAIDYKRLASTILGDEVARSGEAE